MRWNGSRRAMRIGLVAAVATAVLVPAAVAGAYTGDRHWWGRAERHGWQRPPGSPSPSGTSARPSPPGPTTSAAASATGSPSAASPSPQRTTAPAGGYTLPPANAGFDYQIGGAYPPPSGVAVVSRDHAAAPAAGLYSICYVNGFQAQTEEADWWRANHRDLLLVRDGKEVVDGDWDEILLDVSTAAKRAALADIVGGWIDGCAARGFRAVEVDNLDSYTRSGGALTAEHALAYAQLLAARAHRDGLAIGQKNAVEISRAGHDRVGFDFAIAEECAQYDECQDYMAVYSAHVIVIEYGDTTFRRACAAFGATLSIVRRDRAVSTPGHPGYVYDGC